MAKLDGKTAKRYAKALFESAPDSSLEPMLDALNTFAETWQLTPELSNLVQSPVIAQDQKISIIKDLAEQLLSGDVQFANFLSLLLVNNRLSGAAEIAAELAQLIDEKRNVLAVNICSAIELSQEEKDKIQQRIESESSQKAAITWQVDEALIGGLLIQAGDRLLDSSVQGSLDKLKTRLLA